MEQRIADELVDLASKSIRELRTRYAELFGEPTISGNRIWVLRRIAWRLQAIAEGDLSERARRRAEAIVNEADIRFSPPNPRRNRSRSSGAGGLQAAGGDGRLPEPGTVLVRDYKGRKYEVVVLADGFELGGVPYRSLSAVARAITGTHCNGFQFFRLNGEGKA